MDPTFTVQAESEAVCEAALARLCAALEIEPCLLPREVLPGSGRWMARAKPQPSDEVQGVIQAETG
ncbi:hypothetical protein SAMN05421870_107260 [Streptomyces qinglanensis]|uniref:Uncharacterized protein n=1 Tax=Streptomyces qinglanensis TaxID=943816 RepID=A0A1H9U261_9ACTN|nr:hypothetical protein [Streptomyces qinglanensis]SES03680.1 hypothetical protein SAMN05421870_107260 [Streptomyces qinglanensis]